MNNKLTPFRLANSILGIAILALVMFANTAIAQDEKATPAEPPASKTKSTKPASPASPKAKSQDEEKPAEGVTFSDSIQSKWKIGARIVGGSAAAQNVLITIPVPNEWPEQLVSFDEVEVKSTSRVFEKYRDLESGVRQLMVKMPRLGAREEVVVSVTCVVTTNQINAPADTSVFLKPKTNHREGKPYLGVGPDINFRNSKLRNEVKRLVKDKDTPWEEVESILDWVRDNIEDVVQEPSDVVGVFRNKKGCNEDKVGLFVAMCRANKIPARIVWVEGTQHAEFMLIDSTKKAHWFPCRPGGLREFGGLSEPRVVLQKGECIRVPEKEQKQKFVAEFVTCEGKSANSKPRVRFFRELLPE